jgi:hypothetical protein
MKKTNENTKKFYRITGRIVCNTGNFAVCELTAGEYSVVCRGFSDFSDLFEEDFRQLLPVGLRIQCEQNHTGVRFLHRKSAALPTWKEATAAKP